MQPKNQALRLAPNLAQVVKRHSHHGFTGAAANALNDIELLAMVGERQLAHEQPVRQFSVFDSQY